MFQMVCLSKGKMFFFGKKLLGKQKLGNKFFGKNLIPKALTEAVCKVGTFKIQKNHWSNGMVLTIGTNNGRKICSQEAPGLGNHFGSNIT